MKYHELTDRLRKLNEKLDEQYGELLAEDIQEAESLDMSVEDWASWLARKFLDAKAQAEAALKLRDHYAARAEMFTRDMDYRKQGVMELVTLHGKSIKTPVATMYTSKAQPSLFVDEAAVPDEYTKVVKQTDKAKIKQALEGGLEANWASIMPGKVYVVIR